jgi:hypothetical protein
MFPADTQVDLTEFERRDFEQQVVCKVLRSGGAIGRLKSFTQEHQRLHQTPQLSLAWFRDRYPQFPVRLHAVLFAEKPPDWIDMFQHFTTTTVFAAYRRWRQAENLDDRRETLGLVFNLDGITFVLHNHQAAMEVPGRRFIRLLGDPPVTFAFEEFETLLRCIGRSWASPPAAV